MNKKQHDTVETPGEKKKKKKSTVKAHKGAGELSLLRSDMCVYDTLQGGVGWTEGDGRFDDGTKDVAAF